MPPRTITLVALVFSVGLLLPVLTSAQNQAVCTFNVFKIPQTSTIANGISSDGTVVGYTLDVNHTAAGFIRTSDGMITSFSAPHSIDTAFQGTNSLGLRVGWFTDDSDEHRGHAFSLQGNDFDKIDFPDAEGTWASGANDRNEIVGGYRTAGGYEGFVLHNKHFTRIHFPGSSTTWVSGINDFGIIVGWYWRNGIQHGFVRVKNHYFRVDAGPDTALNGINNSGEIVGVYFPQTSPQGFIYQNGEFRDVNVPASSTTNVGGLSGQGLITGPALFADGYSGYVGTCNEFGNSTNPVTTPKAEPPQRRLPVREGVAPMRSLRENDEPRETSKILR